MEELVPILRSSALVDGMPITPLALVPLMCVLTGPRVIATRGKRLSMTVMLLPQLLLTVDAAFYWLRGSPLIPIRWPSPPS